jgi:exopolysaccharide biosynthesis glucuronosyltransferase PssE
MIFVTTGSYEPFDRLLAAAGRLPGDELVVAQCGASKIRPARARCVEFLSFEELVEHVRRARVVVTHAGVGSVLTVLANGKRPIVVPRLRRHGEAVDDHQLGFARRLARTGLVELAEDEGALAEAVASGGGRTAAAPAAGPLAEDLKLYVDAVVARR